MRLRFVVAAWVSDPCFEGATAPPGESAPVTGRELSGDERDRVYNEQARPGFADYTRRTAGIRTIPVLALRRS